MIYQLGVFLLLGMMSVTSALPPCVCTRNLRPVCGSDGITYNNLCLLECAQLSDQELHVARNGRCDGTDLGPANCICTLEYRPVCGTDGRTYGNQCGLTCAQRSSPVELAHTGECRTKRENDDTISVGHEEVKVANIPDCACTREDKPVCGTDGNTYDNPCHLNCARIQDDSLHIDHVGRCTNKVKVVDTANNVSCACTRNLKPVCASNGVTFNNVCLMRCAGTHLTVDREGPCEQ